MNKNIRALIASSAISVFTSAIPAFASDSQALRVTVPFAFTAGTTSLPAGEYTVSEGNSHVMRISGNGGSANLLGILGPDVASGKTALTFEHSGKGYVLKTVYAQGRPLTIR